MVPHHDETTQPQRSDAAESCPRCGVIDRPTLSAWYRPPCLQGLVCPLWTISTLGVLACSIRADGAEGKGQGSRHAHVPGESSTTQLPGGPGRQRAGPRRYGRSIRAD